MTLLLFRDDAYLKSCDAKVLGINERGGIILDQTVFYPTAGGQPGDKGSLMVDGSPIAIATTVYDEAKNAVHVPAEPVSLAQGHRSPPHSTGTTATATCAAIPSCIFSAPRSPSR